MPQAIPAAGRPKFQAEAAGFASQTPANQVISLINGPAADGYPIVNYEYAIVYGNQKDALWHKRFKRSCTGGDDGSGPSFLNKVHFQPLPASVAKLSNAQIAKITG